MYTDLDNLFQKLARSKFRSKFRLNYDDQLFAEMKGPEVLRQHAHDLIIKRLAPEEPLKDGKQTPVKGHPVFVAQHATGCCCRGCLLKWHDIPKHRELSDEEVEYIVRVLLEWIAKNLQKEPRKRRIKKGETLPLL
ncbi:DUF4186 domain-containing protein [Turicimonas muris]|uniref:DUF4186 domain-containing protein n=4 Tax=Turicimonas muris TaxID=1796652 RepID=A0A227KSC3_9BURK|nr:DUF4186 domain-containing protein [Turicimonas muris]ANU65001.1 DUF4186 domain-containing protein [Burkholderiales bacterium YL45]OXE50804.1 DUF4186 domain-containing protein [Turicimonas muris]QQQ96163.1 DUF4186 domain-containing protein [Turicimonas muris]